MASDSSANAGSNLLRGNAPSPSPEGCRDPRKDDCEGGRSGVVGRDVHDRELGGLALLGYASGAAGGTILIINCLRKQSI